MQLRVLGPVEASADHRSLALGGAKQRSVIAMLGLDANRTVSADHLVEGLWGEDAPPSAAKMVQNYVWRLRRVLGDDSGAEILTRGRGYELRIDPDAVDVRRFERLLEAGRAARDGPGSARRARGAGPLARAAAGGRGRRALRRVADPPARGVAAGGDRARDRCRSRRRPPRRGRRGDRGAGGGAPAAGAAPRPADAGALQMRAPGGGARGVPRRAARPGRADRGRARPGAAQAPRRDPAPGRGARDRGGDGRAAARAGCRDGAAADRARGALASLRTHWHRTRAAKARSSRWPAWRASARPGSPPSSRPSRTATVPRCCTRRAPARRSWRSPSSRGRARPRIGCCSSWTTPIARTSTCAPRCAAADLRAARPRRARPRHRSERGGAGAAPPGRGGRAGSAGRRGGAGDRRPVRAARRPGPRTGRPHRWTRVAALPGVSTTSRASGRGARPRDAWAPSRTAPQRAARSRARWSRS